MKIASYLSPRDLHHLLGVSSSWYHFINSSDLIGDSLPIHCTSSEHVLNSLSTFHSSDATLSPFPLRALFLSSVELTRAPSSLKFWDIYSYRITRLEFEDCAVLPRTFVISQDNTKVSTVMRIVHPAILSLIKFQNFHLGCPNLEKLALRTMDKAFMMGGEFLQLHHILCLKNLKELDLSCNKYLTDRILFNLLNEIDKLRSLNLSGCPLVLARAVHNRFYPETLDPKVYSDHILSFEKLVQDFLNKEKGCGVRELTLRATPFNSYTASLIINPASFCWESINLSYCRELKSSDLFKIVSMHAKTLKKLCLNSDGRGPDCKDALLQTELPSLEHLSIRSCTFLKSEPNFLSRLSKLKVLNCSKICGLGHPISSIQLRETFSTLVHLTELNVSEFDSLDDNLLQIIIRTMPSLKKLNLSGTNITDRGTTGMDIDAGILLHLGSLLPPLLLSYGVTPARWGIQGELFHPPENFPMKLPGVDLNPTAYSLGSLKCLEQLDMSNCELLSSGTWYHGLHELVNLYRLNISGCRHVSFNALGVIAENCPSLEYLSLLRCNPVLAQSSYQEWIKGRLKRLRQYVI